MVNHAGRSRNTVQVTEDAMRVHRQVVEARLLPSVVVATLRAAVLAIAPCVSAWRKPRLKRFQAGLESVEFGHQRIMSTLHARRTYADTLSRFGS